MKKVSRPPTTSRVNDYNVLSPKYEKGKVDLERGVYDMKNQQNKATFKYDQEGQFFLGVAKVESKEDETITGESCTVFNYTGGNCHDICLQKKKSKMDCQ